MQTSACCGVKSLDTTFPPHAQCERGKVISVGVHVYIYMFVDQKKLESYFSNQFTFSNIHGRTSRQIYRLPLPLLSPEMLSSLIELKISNLMRTLLYLSEG